MKLSVIIPTLNENNTILRTISKVREEAYLHEIIVVDGGSKDDTCTIAMPLATVLQSEKGRAKQMNEGASIATGDTLLFLHSDTILPPKAFYQIKNTLTNPDVIGGCFRLQFDAPSKLLQFYGWLTRFPWHRIVFGDRALFIRKTAFEALKGYKEIPTFEDLDFVARARKKGIWYYIEDSVITSSRRFKKYGLVRQQLKNIGLWSLYQFGAKPQFLQRFYPYEC